MHNPTAENIRQSVSTKMLMEASGIAVNRQGFAVCPLHHEKTASLKVYDGSRGWWCFGCQTGGDVIDLARHLWGINFHQAIVRLDSMFSLGIVNRPQTAQERREEQRRIELRIEEEKRLEMVLEAAEKACLDCAEEYVQCYHAADDGFSAIRKGEKPSKSQLDAIWNLPIARESAQAAEIERGIALECRHKR